MSTRVYVHPTLPAVIRTYPSNSSGVEFSEANNLAINLEDIAFLDAQPQKVYLIVDVSNLSVSFEDMIKAANVMGRTETGQRKYHHPNVVENIMVVKQRMIEMAAQNLKSTMMGSIQFTTFPTLEEALNYIQEKQGSLR